ncbi:hypothetical protein, partial [Burkholderia metallica]|uniref:hypothetical protein n=1 Tax=Burkholderia metallica TaxID=488729 RepID=UPI001C2E7ACE
MVVTPSTTDWKKKRPVVRSGRFTLQRGGTTAARHSREIETIEVHHLVPGRDEVVRELLLRIRA